MPAHQTTTLRPLTADEQRTLERIVRATSERHDYQQRATALLAVAAGSSFATAARQAGWTTGASVRKLIQRFNSRGLAALAIAPGRGPKLRYDQAARTDLTTLVATPPDRHTDGTAVWSLTTLARAAQRRPHLAHIGRSTIRRMLQASGVSYQRTRSWCPTGTAKRVRKAGIVVVSDPETEEKKA